MCTQLIRFTLFLIIYNDHFLLGACSLEICPCSSGKRVVEHSKYKNNDLRKLEISNLHLFSKCALSFFIIDTFIGARGISILHSICKRIDIILHIRWNEMPKKRFFTIVTEQIVEFCDSVYNK